MKKWLLVLFLIPLTSGVMHEYYVSVFTMKWNYTSGNLEGYAKVFADDLEMLLKDISGAQLALEDEVDQPQIDRLLSDYLQDHVLIVQRKKEITPVYVGYELEKGDAYLYFKFEKFSPTRSFTLENKWMLDFFEDQVNIVHIRIGEKEQSSYFNKSQSKQEVEING